MLLDQSLNDPIFKTDYLEEWVLNGQISSKHGGTDNYYLPSVYIIFSYPRAFTPVCNAELQELNRLLGDGAEGKDGIPIIIGSSDSPEAQQEFYMSKEYFDSPFSLGSFTIRSSALTPKGREILLDEDGYTTRSTVAVADGKIVYVHREFTDEKRDILELERVVNKLKEGKEYEPKEFESVAQ